MWWGYLFDILAQGLGIMQGRRLINFNNNNYCISMCQILDKMVKYRNLSNSVFNVWHEFRLWGEYTPQTLFSLLQDLLLKAKYTDLCLSWTIWVASFIQLMHYRLSFCCNNWPIIGVTLKIISKNDIKLIISNAWLLI